MIKITKGDAPEELLSDAVANLTLALKSDYAASADDYITAKKKFSYTEAYRSPKVKEALRKVQYNKCCFSEAKFTADDSHVEHFRPKGRLDQYPRGSTTYPGYYWLAYDWSNLLLCKSSINSGAKRNFFPVLDEANRNKKHTDTFVEEPILIDPSVDDPRAHIIFKGDEPIGITDRGKLTIELLKLRSSALEEARRTKLTLITALKNAIEQLLVTGSSITDPVIQGFVGELKAHIKPEAEFSSMSTDFLQGWPHIQ